MKVVKILERRFNGKIDRELSNFVETMKHRIQNAILTSIASIAAHKNRSMNASSERDATSVAANSEREEHSGIAVSFESLSEKNKSLHVVNTKDETQNKIPNEPNELSVPDTHFDRQPHTHHSYTIASLTVHLLFVHK